jgi:ppGpp synthetase/RelA/SpoT-type nucleotidyltranferase
MDEHSIEDRLREEYFDLLPKMEREAQSFTTEIEYLLRLIRKELAPHESVLVKTRIKDCRSAIDKLRRQVNPQDPTAPRNPGDVFDRDQPEKYSLLLLGDLVGVRVLVFPPKRAEQVDMVLRSKFRSWKSDPKSDAGEHLTYKYNGKRPHDDVFIPCEYQIVSTLIGLFWDVEHSAIYKQAPHLRGSDLLMQKQTRAVYKALNAFEAEFERRIEKSELNKPSPVK